MEIVNIFEPEGLDRLVSRLNSLTPESRASWGKMDVGQMLRHCNLVFEVFYNKDKFKQPNAVIRTLAKMLIKPMLTGPKPYKKSMRTAPEFVVVEKQVFEDELSKLVANLEKTHSLGSDHFDGKESITFGAMSSKEWNVLWSKHLDHHLMQFGA